MLTNQVARYVFIPAAALIAEKAKATATECVCKPSELPIYTSDGGQSQRDICPSPEEPGVIESGFGSLRRSLFTMVSEVKTWQQIGEDYLYKGLDNAQELIDYLQQEDNTTPKYGAVAVGGVSGLIFGLRGGFFKRTVYASVGALGMAAICYPKEAAEYSQIGIVEAKRYATIAYNFIYGVKKDDPLMELPSLPKLPGSLSEAWDAAKSIGKSTPSPSVAGEPQEEVIDEAYASKIDPLSVITEAHDIATNKSCHCPIGACMGHHEEIPPVTSECEPEVPPPVFECPETYTEDEE